MHGVLMLVRASPDRALFELVEKTTEIECKSGNKIVRPFYHYFFEYILSVTATTVVFRH